MSSPRVKLPPSPRARKAPPSPMTRGLLYSKLSSVVEGSFLDDDGIGINASASPRIGRYKGSPRIGRFKGSPRVGRFKEQRTNFTQVAPSQVVTESVRLQQEMISDRHVLSFVVVYTMIFFNGCCFTAVVPSVPFYLHFLGAPPSFLGLVVSFYSLGQIIGSPTAGWLNDRVESKTMLTFSSLLGIVASTFYAAAPSYWFILLSRVLTGISAGMEFTTELAFIARNTTTEERTTFLASVTAVNVLGFIMGPALTTVLSMLNFEIMRLKVNSYTGPGWLLVIMFCLDVLMIRCLYKDSSLADDASSDASTSALLESDENESTTSYGAINEEEELDEMENDSLAAARREPAPPSLTLILSLIFVQFTVMCAWSVLETITSPLASDSFGWTIQECNILFTCGGVASLIAYISFVIASKWVEDRWLIVFALVACFIGLVLMIHWTLPMLPPYKYCFLVGYLIMNAGFMTGRPVTFALYSKLVPQQYQGEYLGLMVAGGSAARTLGPFVAVYLYYHVDAPFKNSLALFGSEATIMTICLVLVISLWPSLLPAKAKLQTVDTEYKQLSDKSSASPHSVNGDISMHDDEKGLPQ